MKKTIHNKCIYLSPENRIDYFINNKIIKKDLLGDIHSYGFYLAFIASSPQVGDLKKSIVEYQHQFLDDFIPRYKIKKNE